MVDLYPVYMDIDGVRTKCTAYMDIDGIRTLISKAKQDAPISNNYLTFSSAEPFTIGVSNATKNWNGTLEYSTDAATWSEWDGTTAITSAEHGADQRIYMRGVHNTKIGTSSSSSRWVLTGNSIACNGNIETLLDYETVVNGEHPTMANYCYGFMFRGCTSLTTAPALPATTLAFGCYSSMFSGCTSLITAPELPATTLSIGCYANMFFGCTLLTSVPELPATTLENNCYADMFRGCTSLKIAPELPATTLAKNCYEYMFDSCTSLTTAPTLPATTLADNCYYSMFYGCTSLTTVPELPATTLPSQCYRYMFYGCTSIKLSATPTDKYQTEYRIPASGTGTTASYTLTEMFTRTGGTFTGTPEINTIYYTTNEVV